MAKGKSKRKQKDGPPGAEGGAGPSADYQGPGESWGGEHMNQAAAPILAMHPIGAHVAVAYGKGVAVFDTATGARIPLRAASDVPSIGEGVAHTPASPAMRAPLDPSGDWHAEAIRAIAFDPSGRFLATAGDDKAVRLFAKTDEPAYECVRRWHDRKKVRSFFFISTRAIILTSCLFAINSHPRSRSTTPERT
jgi:WD40 repeat protein